MIFRIAKCRMYRKALTGSVLAEKGDRTMPDREKVIKGLKCCQCADCIGRQCPYWHDVMNDAIKGCDCTTELVRDALTLLREQAEKIASLERTIEDICCGGGGR